MKDSININLEDMTSLLVYSFRYVLGRMTYAPSEWVSIFNYVYPQLDEKNQEFMLSRLKAELEEAFRIEKINPKSLGWECDRKLWHDFYETLTKKEESTDGT